jgi:hypothetical protein
MPQPSTETQPPSITETQYRTISETWEIIPGTLIGTQESDGLTKVTTARSWKSGVAVIVV